MYDSLTTTANTWLGAPPDAGGSPAAWGEYLGALRDKIQLSKASAISSYNTLKQVRENLGLPFFGGGGEGSDPNAWTQNYEQEAVDLIAMAKVFTDAANDAIAGKRKLIWDDQAEDFAIEGFKTDLLKLQADATGTPVLVDGAGYPQHASGQVGTPVVVFGIIAAGAVVSTVGLGLILWKGFDTFQVVAQQKTERTVAEATKKHADLVAQGKATPAEAEALNNSIYKGATDLRKAATEPKAKQTADITDAVKTLAWVGLGIGVLYVVAQVIRGGGVLAGARDNPDYTRERIFYLPAHMRDVPPLTPSGTDLEIWTWEDERKSPKTGEMVKTFHGIAFAGKAGKPLWHHWFGTAASRMKMITDSIASRKAHITRIEERSQKRRTYKHTLKVGNILVSHWGYEQTNIDFYEVTAVKEKSVVICKIGSREVEAKQNLSLVVPVPGKCYGEPMTKRVSEGGYVRLTSYSSASLWDGKPEYETASGWGH